MKKEIYIEKLHQDRQDSFWYESYDEIAKFTKGDREILIIVTGNLRVKFINEDFYRKNNQAVDFAISQNLFDNDLENIEFDEGKWFDFVYKKGKKGQEEDILGDEEFNYSEALSKAEEVLEDDDFWEQF